MSKQQSQLCWLYEEYLTIIYFSFLQISCYVFDKEISLIKCWRHVRCQQPTDLDIHKNLARQDLHINSIEILTHWSLGDRFDFKYIINKCIFVTRGSDSWKSNIDSGNGLVPSGNKPLHELKRNKLYGTIWYHRSQWIGSISSYYYNHMTTKITLLLDIVIVTWHLQVKNYIRHQYNLTFTSQKLHQGSMSYMIYNFESQYLCSAEGNGLIYYHQRFT